MIRRQYNHEDLAFQANGRVFLRDEDDVTDAFVQEDQCYWHDDIVDTGVISLRVNGEDWLVSGCRLPREPLATKLAALGFDVSQEPRP